MCRIFTPSLCSTAAATLAASCKIPSRRVVPFANKPQDVFPGVAKYYATTYVQDGDVVPVIAKVRDGRPIKIEGNDHALSFTQGGTSARVQASVLDLYDMYRLPHPQRKVNNKIPHFFAFFASKNLSLVQQSKSI